MNKYIALGFLVLAVGLLAVLPSVSALPPKGNCNQASITEWPWGDGLNDVPWNDGQLCDHPWDDILAK